MLTFATLRSRLLALIALAMLPVVVLAIALSWRIFVTAEQFALDAYRQTASAVATQERSVLRAALRVLRSLAEIQAADTTVRACEDRLGRVVEANAGYGAIVLMDENGIVCGGGALALIEGFERAALTAPLGQQSPNAYNIALGRREGRPIVAITVPARGRDAVLVAVLDADWFADILADVTPLENGTVAVLDQTGEAIVQHGHEKGSTGWLPQRPVARAATLFDPTFARDRSRDGRAFVYFLVPVHADRLQVLVGFPEADFGIAERQLLVGILSPILLSFIVLAVAWVAVDRLVLRWVRRLNRTARRLAFGDFSVRATMPDAAPLELRQYAGAFDQMTEALGTRAHEIALVAQQRSGLMRELHHRVKNNFQVIASFLNLMRREQSGETREMALALAECRVHAMAAAYKLALAQGDIRLVSVPTLVGDVVAYAQQLTAGLREPVDAEIRGEGAFLDLDRAMALSLLVVEVLWPVIGADGTRRAVVRLAHAEDRHLHLTIGGMSQPPKGIPSRFARAFLQQLQAKTVPDTGSDTVLAVTFPIESAQGNDGLSDQGAP
ncbi:histidine kinase dimerization/phosphoacceptor domain -containing protein [Chelatococcus sp. SYSU_G07232]|uniref:histidine kinase n=1 Tax=Chelatococcus albus TaxID=3047466 RepID=A0ABT7AIB6_9HYPH|nr:histidine kinase dimerization/phosphoacceptor domain -containing protein [Chelatococcus sp. SYSU_G07232]MDJ1158529.1 histidine kinase dimerization/phosphoacceptor domain -containing protein [Chelatococcus sp. SYSU_G07232]